MMVMDAFTPCIIILLYTLFTYQCTKRTNEDHVFKSEKRMFGKMHIVVSQKIKKH